jgi:hypothetical protein
MMALKVYLAGGFYQENDWRYDVVSGLKGNIPYEARGTMEKWGTIPNSILGCLDFVGPYPEDDMILWHRLALAESDIVFLWATADYISDIAKMSSELGYAGALGKMIGVGSDSEDNELFQNIRHAVYMGEPWYPTPAVADNPTDALRLFLHGAIDGLTVHQIVKFRKSSHIARQICGQRYERSGYVYIIRADTGHYKIGRTNNVPKRMKLFTVKLPFDFEIITYFPCEDMYMAESRLHGFFADKRINGEWFNLDQGDVETIKTINDSVSDLFFDKSSNPISILISPSDGIPWYQNLTPEEKELIS